MDGAALFLQTSDIPLATSVSNKNVEQKIFEHPRLSEIMTDLTTEFSNYKYTVYRCAAKIVALEQKLFTDKISFKLIQAVLGRHGMSEAESNLMVPPFQLTSLIHDIYFASESLGNFSNIKEYELEIATTVLANFFWNVFDPHRRHSISLLEVKATFLLLCKLPDNDDLILEFYQLISDRKSSYVSKFFLEYLVNIFAKILTYIGEGNAYGAYNISKTIEQCFERCHNTMGLTKQQFNNLWSSTQTRFLIYANLIITVKRIECTRKIIHSNSCVSCGVEKIVGIRFKCRSCKNLSLCLKCFASGYSTNKHKTGHRLYEMFSEDAPPKKITRYLANLCTVFVKSANVVDYEEEKQFCNENENNASNKSELVVENVVEANKLNSSKSANSHDSNPYDSAVNALNKIEHSFDDLTKSASNALDVSARLQSIIDRLLIQNFKVEQYLKLVPNATPDQIAGFLISHQKFLTDIIKEMRDFKKISNLNGKSIPTSSTPNHSGCLNKALLLDSSNISTTGNNLTHSINGADINRSYLEANKSDYSLNDVSVWFNQQKVVPYSKPCSDTSSKHHEVEIPLSSFITTDVRETEMANFRLLLNKVKEIVEDSYSDNIDLAAATQNLENVLDSIIKCEETRRCSLDKRFQRIKI